MYYPYSSFVEDIKSLVKQIAPFRPDALLGISRGGLIPLQAISQATDNRNVFTINSVLYDGEVKRSRPKLFNLPDMDNPKRVLIIDDIVDSGQTLEAVLVVMQERYGDTDFKSASLFYRENACILPDYTIHKTEEWIDFFWEKDFLDT